MPARAERLWAFAMLAASVITLSVVASGCLKSTANIQGVEAGSGVSASSGTVGGVAVFDSGVTFDSGATYQ
jgi:hypothetical protein